MIIHVLIKHEDCSILNARNGSVGIVPFTGTVESDLFTGIIRPGGTDVQVTDTSGVKHLCARYLLEGKDATGKDCRIYVENNGYFEKGHNPIPFTASPTFMTDSEYLFDILCRPVYVSEGHPTPKGVDIWIIDPEK